MSNQNEQSTEQPDPKKKDKKDEPKVTLEGKVVEDRKEGKKLLIG